MTPERLEEIEKYCLADETAASEMCLEVIDELRRFWWFRSAVVPLVEWGKARLRARKNDQDGFLPPMGVLDGVDDFKLRVFEVQRLIDADTALDETATERRR